MYSYISRTAKAMDTDALRAQLVECDRTILELNYLFSETLQRQEVLQGYYNRLRNQVEEKRIRLFFLKTPLPGWAKAALRQLNQEMQQAQSDLESISCNIRSCHLFRMSVERRLAQTFDS